MGCSDKSAGGIDGGKNGGTLDALEPEEMKGQLCGTSACKNHPQSGFSRGPSLNGPKGLLHRTGK
jgi:hypothetical protein